MKETSHATPKQVRIITRRKSSWFLVRVISYMIRGMTHFAKTTRTRTIKRSLITSVTSASPERSGVADSWGMLARNGMAMIMGIAIRSWKIRIPRAILPCGESISPFW